MSRWSDLRQRVAVAARPPRAWRSSVSLRVVVTTLALSLLVVGLVGVLLVGRITSGLLDAKERASLAEARSGADEAQNILDAADTRLVNVHVQRLRSKIEHDPERPQIVVTVRGVGYKAGPP